MEMSNSEIKRKYLAAKNKTMQVGILADLNMCSKDKIIEILKQEGVSHQQLPRIRKNSPQVKKAENKAGKQDMKKQTVKEFVEDKNIIMDPETVIMQEQEAIPASDIKAMLERTPGIITVADEEPKVEVVLQKVEVPPAVMDLLKHRLNVLNEQIDDLFAEIRGLTAESSQIASFLENAELINEETE